MKTSTNKQLHVPALIVALSWILAGRATAVTYTNLHAFAGGTEGSNPYAGLTLSGTTLYGTTPNGGTGHGTVFKINTDGTGFTNIYSFTGGSDGGAPYAGVIVSGGTLYGTTQVGSSGSGTVFSVTTNASVFSLLHTFNAGTDGAEPEGTLLLAGNLLYGTTFRGGSGNVGTLYVVNTSTMDFTNLHDFIAPVESSWWTNADGGNTDSALVLSGHTLYGVMTQYGPNGSGTVFAMNTDRSGFTNLYAFSAQANDGTLPPDGALPHSGVVVSGGTVYGTSFNTMFKIDTGGFKVMHTFDGGDDGSGSVSRMILSGATLYGATTQGGSQNAGIVYAVNVNGTGFTNIYSFANGVAGAAPTGDLVLSGTNLYGTTSHGDSINTGVVFRLSGLPLSVGVPQLGITHAGTNVIVNWSTDFPGFTLQSATNLAATAVWTTVSGQNAVTNPISGKQTFYRLIQ